MECLERGILGESSSHYSWVIRAQRKLAVDTWQRRQSGVKVYSAILEPGAQSPVDLSTISVGWRASAG